MINYRKQFTCSVSENISLRIVKIKFPLCHYFKPLAKNSSHIFFLVNCNSFVIHMNEKHSFKYKSAVLLIANSIMFCFIIVLTQSIYSLRVMFVLQLPRLQIKTNKIFLQKSCN